MQIIITNDQGSPPVRCELDEWLRENKEAFEPADLEKIVDTLQRGETYRVGGGAMALFTLTSENFALARRFRLAEEANAMVNLLRRVIQHFEGCDSLLAGEAREILKRIDG